jgi:hypothetical protein
LTTALSAWRRLTASSAAGAPERAWAEGRVRPIVRAAGRWRGRCRSSRARQPRPTRSHACTHPAAAVPGRAAASAGVEYSGTATRFRPVRLRDLGVSAAAVKRSSADRRGRGCAAPARLFLPDFDSGADPEPRGLFRWSSARRRCSRLAVRPAPPPDARFPALALPPAEAAGPLYPINYLFIDTNACNFRAPCPDEVMDRRRGFCAEKAFRLGETAQSSRLGPSIPWAPLDV